MKPEQTTPLMEQYHRIKKQHKDAVLFFRMGDFYEMFYEDAHIGAKVLGITLTSRSHGKAADVPLAGFPHHALETYLAKMIKAGYRVAICEQVEDPKLAKTVVKREVIEIVTPGTAVSDDLLESKKNFLLALCFEKNAFGIAKTDVSTGEFEVGEFPLSILEEKIRSIEPAEILVAETQEETLRRLCRSLNNIPITVREEWHFNYDLGRDLLLEHFGTLSLKGFGIEGLALGIAAAGAAFAYLRENQKERLRHIAKISLLADDEIMQIDSTTRRNLELIAPMNASNRRATLLSVIDQTLTPMGGRKLVHWLLYPLLNVEKIRLRQDAVEELMQNNDLREKLRGLLRQIGDIERLLTKFATNRANARDANAVKNALLTIAQIKSQLVACKSHRLVAIREELDTLEQVARRIASAIVENPPLSVTEGGFIRRGYHEELDSLRDIAYSGKDWIARLQQEERQKTGIASLKVNYNKVFGYYIEVTKPNLARVPSHYIRKQTLVNAERFITQELKEYEEKILGAEEKMAAIEYELFNELRDYLLSFTLPLQTNSALIAELDCYFSLAQTAVEHHYCRPQIDESDRLEIKEGRHPVIERLLPPGEQFVANDLYMDNKTEQILIITGPNMAGKSTFLRQTALIVILAQMGSFVPAASAKIGLVDRLFTRVGASDNLAAGESTFLTEMNETANILNNATARSLIILDEIGRGTSTFDGLSIAWSVVEYLHNTPKLAAKTLFATHYHELTELELVLPRVKNYNVAVREWGDHIVFLRKIVPGSCDHSYGIQVAKLAGLPKAVIERAKEVLKNLEAEALTPDNEPRLALHRPQQVQAGRQIDLFEQLEKSLRQELAQINPNELTPIEALQKLDQLKQLAGSAGKS
ncbi:MAG: DNA mismatch repair protein MutS [candidate division KSB1 bacterium]|nr:DNA mismatch repair protein MutS [candidate division KSB1 bacterium]